MRGLILAACLAVSACAPGFDPGRVAVAVGSGALSGALTALKAEAALTPAQQALITAACLQRQQAGVADRMFVDAVEIALDEACGDILQGANNVE